MSAFDPASFLEASVTESNDTKLTPVPVGEYTAVVDKVDARQWNAKDGSKSGMALDVTWAIDDATGELKKLLGREKITVKQGVMLDITEQGGLDMGKGRNVNLGRLREATGLNSPGVPFSFRQLEGRVAKVTIAHRVVDQDLYADVKGVAKIA